MHTRTLSAKHAHTYTRTQTYTDRKAHTHIHTDTHAHTHTDSSKARELYKPARACIAHRWARAAFTTRSFALDTAHLTSPHLIIITNISIINTYSSTI